MLPASAQGSGKRCLRMHIAANAPVHRLYGRYVSYGRSKREVTGMRDLNDFYFFYAVVLHEGFSAASRKIGVPKGTLSKAVARLEDRLQVRLLERSTRRLRTTDVGRLFYQQCEA